MVRRCCMISVFRLRIFYGIIFTCVTCCVNHICFAAIIQKSYHNHHHHDTLLVVKGGRKWSQKSPPFLLYMMERIIIDVPRGGDDSVQDDSTTMITTSSTNNTVANTTLMTTTAVQFQKQCDERSVYIKDLLQRRHQHVLTGKRMKDIVTYMKDHSSEDPTESIISIHGLPHRVKNLSGTPTGDNETSSEVVSTSIPPSTMKVPKRRIHKNDPFPIDRRNLNFDTNILLKQSQINNSDSTPVSCFVDTTGKISLDMTPPSILQLSVRMVRLLINFAPVWSTMGIALLSSSFRQQYWYQWVTQSIGKSGAAWIKWGQWSATRNDMFPEALCDQLATLHASAPAHPWSYSALVIEQSLGLGPGTLHCVFDNIHTEPIASGSIAQVHKATICGQPVAIKIRHPNVQQIMEMDFQLMTFGASLMDQIPALSWLHIRESIVQFSNAIVAQAYLQVEAHHLEVLNYNFRTWPRVSFPKPIFASSSMIIETFEPGEMTTDVVDKYNNIAGEINRYQNRGMDDRNGVTVIEAETVTDSQNNILVETSKHGVVTGYDLMPVKLAKFLVCSGVSMYLKMLLIDNLMHGDLHPGNIMVDAKYRKSIQKGFAKDEKRLTLISEATFDQPFVSPNDDVLAAIDDTSIEQVRITLVDAGMVVKLTDEESSAFIGLLSSLGEGNGDEAAAYTLQFSLERNSMSVAQKRFFAADMVLLFQERCRGYGTNVDVGHVLRGVLSLIRKHRVRIDANFATLVINCLCLESLARGVCPAYNVLDAARPLLQGYRNFAEDQSRERPESTPWFLFRMSLNAMKKNFDDRRFFRKQAKQKFGVRQAVEKLILDGKS